MKTQVNLKIDADVKKEAQERAKEVGLSLSSIVNATLKQFAKSGDFYVSAGGGTPTPYLEKVIRDARAEYERGETSGPFDNTEDLMKHLES